MRQLWKEREVIRLCVEQEKKLLYGDFDIFKICELYLERYCQKEILEIRKLKSEQEKEKAAKIRLMDVATIVDHCEADGYLKHKEDGKLQLTSKGRKFVQFEYFIQAIAEQLGLGLSLLMGLGLGAGIRELIWWVWRVLN